MDLLKHTLLQLAPLPEAAWKQAEGCFQRKTLSKDAYYLRPNEPCTRISFIERGLFRLFYLQDGQEKIMLFFQEGQFMADYVGFLTQTPSVRPIQALEEAVVYHISSQDLQALYERHKAWERIGRLLAKRAYLYAVQRANRLLHDDFDTRFTTFMQEHPSPRRDWT